jgi:hypothetical protein
MLGNFTDEKYPELKNVERADQDEDVKDPLDLCEKQFCFPGKKEAPGRAKMFTHKFSGNKRPDQVDASLVQTDIDDAKHSIKLKEKFGPPGHPAVIKDICRLVQWRL